MNTQLFLKTSTALLLVMTVSLAGCSGGGGGHKSYVASSDSGTDAGTGGGTDGGVGGGAIVLIYY